MHVFTKSMCTKMTTVKKLLKPAAYNSKYISYRHISSSLHILKWTKQWVKKMHYVQCNCTMCMWTAPCKTSGRQSKLQEWGSFSVLATQTDANQWKRSDVQSSRICVHMSGNHFQVPAPPICVRTLEIDGISSLLSTRSFLDFVFYC